MKQGGIIVFEDVMERIRSYLEQRNGGNKIHDKVIAASLDMRPAAYSNAKKRNRVPIETVAHFCARNRINLNWILYGQPLAMLDTDAEDAYMVRLLGEIHVSAGGGANNEDLVESTYLRIDKKTWQKLGLKKKGWVDVIRITGDSMEPTLSENELILVDRLATEVETGEVYVINTPDGAMVKRLMLGTKGLMIHSDNTRYAPQMMEQDEIMVIGKVIGVLDKT